MQAPQQQKTKTRQLRLQLSDHNLKQKQSFRKLFSSSITINWKDAKITKLISMGIPSGYRSCVWPKLISNSHGITQRYYECLLGKAQMLMSQNKNSMCQSGTRTVQHLQRIQLDIDRTLPQLKIFTKQSQQGQLLFNLLAAWTVHRQDIGYLQGMSQLAGLLLLQLEQLPQLYIKTVLFRYYVH